MRIHIPTACYSSTQVQSVVKLFVKVIGTDLATYTEMNCLWHTGNARDLRNDTNIKQCQPWEYVQRVATACSVGQGCAKAEWWNEFLENMINEQVFCM